MKTPSKSAINKNEFIQKKLANVDSFSDIRSLYAIFQCLTFIGEIFNPHGNMHTPLSENVMEKFLKNTSQDFLRVRNILSGSIFPDVDMQALHTALRQDMQSLKDSLEKALEEIEINHELYKPKPFVAVKKASINILSFFFLHKKYENCDSHQKDCKPSRIPR